MSNTLPLFDKSQCLWKVTQFKLSHLLGNEAHAHLCAGWQRITWHLEDAASSTLFYCEPNYKGYKACRVLYYFTSHAVKVDISFLTVNSYNKQVLESGISQVSVSSCKMFWQAIWDILHRLFLCKRLILCINGQHFLSKNNECYCEKPP